MSLSEKKIGYVIPSDHFTMPLVLAEMKRLVDAGAEVFPLFLATSQAKGEKAPSQSVIKSLVKITGREISFSDTTRIPSFDLIVIAPCPGDILHRLVHNLSEPVAAACVLQHLQQGLPIVLALVANGNSGDLLKTIGQILEMRSIYLVPFGPAQEKGKQILLSRLDLLCETISCALANRQLQPVYLETVSLPQ